MNEILSNIQLMLWGTVLTLQLLVCAIAIGFLLAIILTIFQLSGKKYLVWPSKIYIFLIRGTPLLVQFFLIYFGVSQFDAIRHSFLWIILKQPFACAVLALAINTSAYTSVLLYGAVAAIPKGEIEACKALGMPWLLMLWRIIFPRAFRIALPAYSNEIIMVLKGTSLASTITLMELFGVTKQIISQTYADMQYMLMAGLIYFMLNAALISGFRYLERKQSLDSLESRR